jgi:hypothetical protein
MPRMQLCWMKIDHTPFTFSAELTREEEEGYEKGV